VVKQLKDKTLGELEEQEGQIQVCLAP